MYCSMYITYAHNKYINTTCMYFPQFLSLNKLLTLAMSGSVLKSLSVPLSYVRFQMTFR